MRSNSTKTCETKTILQQNESVFRNLFHLLCISLNSKKVPKVCRTWNKSCSWCVRDVVEQHSIGIFVNPMIIGAPRKTVSTENELSEWFKFSVLVTVRMKMYWYWLRVTKFPILSGIMTFCTSIVESMMLDYITWENWEKLTTGQVMRLSEVLRNWICVPFLICLWFARFSIHFFVSLSLSLSFFLDNIKSFLVRYFQNGDLDGWCDFYGLR